MADFTKTITNGLRVFGVNPSTKWGDAVAFQTMVWGTTKWGEGTTPLAFIVQKVISESITPTWDKSEASLGKTLDFGSVSPSFEMSAEQLRSGDWLVVFSSDTTNGEDRDFASWTSATAPDVTFTCAAAAGTTWSEL